MIKKRGNYFVKFTSTSASEGLYLDFKSSTKSSNSDAPTSFFVFPLYLDNMED